MQSKNNNKKSKSGFGVKAKDLAKEIADYTAKYNKWRLFMFEQYIRENANPTIDGEITDEKLKAAGIKIMTKGTSSWLEQNGKMISAVLKPKPFTFDYSPYIN